MHPIDSQSRAFSTSLPQALRRKLEKDLKANNIVIMAAVDAGASILHSLRGTKLFLPDLGPIYDKWTRGLNPHYERLVPIINKQLERIVHHNKRLVHYKAMDFALFTAM